MDVVPANLKAARQAASLTQDAVARRMGVTLRSYCRWESGETIPGIPTLRRLAAVLGVTVSTLIEEEDQ